MTESLEIIIRNSFGVWRKNPNLGLPYLFNTIVNITLVLAFAASVFLFFNPLRGFSLSGFNPMDIDWPMLFLDIGLFILLIIATTFSSLFFHAGSIGMSYKALETGRCSLDDLTRYGGKKFITLFLADIIILVPLAVVACGLLLLQMIFPGEFVAILSLLAGIALVMVPYAIVIGDMGPVQGIKAGYGIFKENKFQTALLYFFTNYFLLFSIYGVMLACMVICSLALFFIPMPQEFTAPEIVSALMPSIWMIAVAVLLAAVFYILAETMVLMPLLTIFWTAYYMSKTKQRRAL
jgi:hypothetical protein